MSEPSSQLSLAGQMSSSAGLLNFTYLLPLGQKSRFQGPSVWGSRFNAGWVQFCALTLGRYRLSAWHKSSLVSQSKFSVILKVLDSLLNHPHAPWDQIGGEAGLVLWVGRNDLCPDS